MVLRNKKTRSGDDQSVEAVAVESEVIGPANPKSSADRESVLRLVRKRLKKFMSFIPAVLRGEEVDAVHDVRVWSRRLQQSLTALSSKSPKKRVRRLRQTLRGVRRTLGEWRNCDVALDLLARERRRTRARTTPDCWKPVAEYAGEKRSRQITLAQRKLRKYDLADFSRRVQKWLDQFEEAKDGEALAALGASVETGWRQWHSALARARKTCETDDLHRFRIASKRLRYRIEMLRDLGNKDVRPVIQWLKALQEAVGLWHDQQSLRAVTAEALARPEFLLAESEAARSLLAELEKHRLRQSEAVEKIFHLAETPPSLEFLVGRALKRRRVT